MNHVTELYIAANEKNRCSLPVKSVTTHIPNMHVRRRTALVELRAVHFLTEAVNVFLMLLKKKKLKLFSGYRVVNPKTAVAC